MGAELGGQVAVCIVAVFGPAGVRVDDGGPSGHHVLLHGGAVAPVILDQSDLPRGS